MMTYVRLPVALLVLAACGPERVELESGPRGPFYAPGPFGDPSDEIYAADSLPRFDLDLPAESLAALRGAPREYAPATLRYRDEVYPGVGVRLKGEASFRPLGDKAGFKVKLDEFSAGQRLRGLRRLTWNNAVQDPTFLAERLASEFARAAGVPAPRANSALVFVNGEFYGVYTNLETPDKVFLGRWFESDDGNLYEEHGRDLVAGAEGVFELETNEAENDRSDLAMFIAVLDRVTPESFDAEIAAVLDLDEYLRFAAFEALVGHWDGYCFGGGPRNNFRLYHDPATGWFHFIPGGMDQTMQPASPPPLTAAWVAPVDEVQPFEVFGRVITLCLQSPTCQRRYAGALAQLSDQYEAMDLVARAATMAAQVRADVRADVLKPGDDAYTDYAQGVQRDFIARRPAAVRAALP